MAENERLGHARDSSKVETQNKFKVNRSYWKYPGTLGENERESRRMYTVYCTVCTSKAWVHFAFEVRKAVPRLVPRENERERGVFLKNTVHTSTHDLVVVVIK